MEAVLSTLEIAYAKAHEDAAGDGPYADYAQEILQLTRVLTELLPREPEALALAAIVRYAEARRPARTDANGVMIPLSEQNPKFWRRELIEAAETYLVRAAALDGVSPRSLEAAIHGAWCARRTLAEPAPWPLVLSLYNILLTVSDKGSRGERIDTSGEAIRELLAAVDATVERYAIVPDERDRIAAQLREWADAGLDAIFTTGGTGLASRDLTPEATLAVLDYEVPGIGEAMRAEGIRHTPFAMLSRARSPGRRKLTNADDTLGGG